VDRHVAKRIPSNGTKFLQFIVKPNFRVRWASLWDASTTGLGLLITEPVAPGSVLGLLLNFDFNDCRVVTALARHCTPAPDQTWVLGCELREPLSGEELLVLTCLETSAFTFTFYPSSDPGP
jgi:hypothetical protein